MHRKTRLNLLELQHRLVVHISGLNGYRVGEVRHHVNQTLKRTGGDTEVAIPVLVPMPYSYMGVAASLYTTVISIQEGAKELTTAPSFSFEP